MKFVCSKACDDLFAKVKEAVVEATWLAHFDPRLPLFGAADASPYRVGAGLMHVSRDGSHRPIAFLSKTLSASQKNYI